MLKHNSGKFTVRPLYLLVRDTIVQNIAVGEWAAGKALPNEHDLAKQLGVSMGTVRRALAEVENELLIYRVQGRGTYVADHSKGVLATRFSRLFDPNNAPIHGLATHSNWSKGTANEDEARQLRLNQSAPVLRIQRGRSCCSHTFAWDRCSLPSALYSKLPDDLGDYRITALAQDNGVILARGAETVSADVASADDAEWLDVKEGSPILVLDRVIICGDGRVAEWRVSRCALREKRYIAELA